MKNEIVFILNYAPHYRLFLFEKIGNGLNADFYFGDIPNSSIKKLNYKELSNFKNEFKTIKLFSFYWCLSSIRLVFKPYKSFVLTGDPQILSNWFLLFFAKILRKNTFLWTHGWYGREKGLKKLMKKAFFSLSNNFLLYNETSKGLMVKEGFCQSRLIPIYNSLDYDKQKIIRDNLKTSTIYFDYFKNSNPVLIYIGRVQSSKKIGLLLEALKKFKSQNIIYNLIVVGGNSEGYSLEKIIKKFEIENQVWLFGPSYDEQTNAELIYNANLCVSPGNVGLTAIHSLMYGTPVITHNTFTNQGPEWECILDGENGCFFKENDTEDLMDKIFHLINNPLEREKCYKVIDEKWNPANQLNILKKEIK